MKGKIFNRTAAIFAAMMILSVTFFACSRAPAKKLERMQEDNPELFETATLVDTVNVVDEVTIESVTMETVFNLPLPSPSLFRKDKAPQPMKPQTLTSFTESGNKITLEVLPSKDKDGAQQIRVNCESVESKVPIKRTIIVKGNAKVPKPQKVIVKPRFYKFFTWWFWGTIIFSSILLYRWASTKNITFIMPKLRE